MNRIAICLIAFLLGVSTVVAQLPTATILGQVKDATGAIVAGTKITARNTDTGLTRTAVTADDGSYRLDALPVGNYELTAEKTGFKTEVQSGLTLTVTQQAVENFTIQVGEMSQTVAVTAEAPLISTTTSSLGGLVDDQRIADLPLNGRNYNDLTLLQPGVTQHVYVTQSTLGLSGTEYSSNGAPIRSNTYLLDGAIMQNQQAASGASAIGTTLGVDGILEYRVITNNFSAEYGGSMGSIQTLVSKGGTNQFHGDAFEFLRNSNLDARNYFDLPPATIGHRLPEFRRNNFGGALGGPIKKDKTFFFGVYERLSQSLGTTNTATVFPAGCHGAAGAVITPAACPSLSSPVTIAPQMVGLLGLFPIPNLGLTSYGFAFTQPTSEHYGQIRVDHTFSSSDTFFVRYTVDEASQGTVYNEPSFTNTLQSRNQFITLSENHIISTSLLNTARFSFSRTPILYLLGSTVSGPQFGFSTGLPVGQINVNGFTINGSNTSGPTQYLQNVFTWADDLDYTHGRHSLKFGALFNHYQWNLYNFGSPRGQVTFGGVAQFLTAQLLMYTGVPASSVLQRHYHFDTMGFYVQDDWRVTPRLTLNLGMRYEPTTTYNETNGLSSSIRNYLTDTTYTIGPPFQNPSLRNFSPRFGFAWDVKGDGRTAIRGGFSVLYDLTTLGGAVTTALTTMPPFDQTALVTSGTFTLPMVIPPGTLSTFRGPEYYASQPHDLQYNLTVERQLPASMGLTVAYAGSRGMDLPQNKDGNPAVPNGIPSGGTCIPAPAGTIINTTSMIDGSATSCYIATGLKRRNTNFPQVTIIPTGGDSIYSALEVLLNKRLSKGLQLQSSYTWSKLIDDGQGGTVGDDNGPNSVRSSDPLHEKTERGPADFDVTQNWRLNAIYRFPDLTSSKGFLGKLENGWWTSGIFALQSGYPLTAGLGTTRSQDGETAAGNLLDRPDIVRGRYNSNITHGVSTGCGTGAVRAAGGSAIPAGTPLGTQTLWYDPCAFYLQPQGFLGTAGRNILRGPGFDDLNFSLVKDTAVGFLGEGGKIEFRAEFFNLLNRVNFASPALAASTVYAGTCVVSGVTVITACGPTTSTVLNANAGAGIITATNGTSRQIQFGLKILF